MSILISKHFFPSVLKVIDVIKDVSTDKLCCHNKFVGFKLSDVIKALCFLLLILKSHSFVSVEGT